MDVLPGDWTWDGKRVLDFGCGSGRILMLEEANFAEIWGVDIFERNTRDVEENFCPPMRALLGPEPPLPFDDRHFDLIWAISVWTHPTDTAHAWVAEMHGILRPAGLLIATYMGESHSERLAGEERDEQRIGMNVLRHWEPWIRGGPMVVMSDWWVREHGGRGFDLVRIEPDPLEFNWPPLRKRDVELSAEDIERLSDHPRERHALRHNVRQVQREVETALREREQHFAAERECCEQARAEYENSLSWRITKPLRDARRLARDGRRRRRP